MNKKSTLILLFTLSCGLAYANNKINKNDNNENVTEKISSENISSLISDDSTKYFTDPRDEKKYPIVTIGNQTWMAKNLAFVPEDGEYKEFVHPDINSEDSNCLLFSKFHLNFNSIFITSRNETFVT